MGAPGGGAIPFAASIAALATASDSNTTMLVPLASSKARVHVPLTNPSIAFTLGNSRSLSMDSASSTRSESISALPMTANTQAGVSFSGSRWAPLFEGRWEPFSI